MYEAEARREPAKMHSGLKKAMFGQKHDVTQSAYDEAVTRVAKELGMEKATYRAVLSQCNIGVGYDTQVFHALCAYLDSNDIPEAGTELAKIKGMQSDMPAFDRVVSIESSPWKDSSYKGGGLPTDENAEKTLKQGGSAYGGTAAWTPSAPSVMDGSSQGSTVNPPAASGLVRY